MEKNAVLQGVWIRKCPLCGSYFKKSDPEENSTCCACGWQEHGDLFSKTDSK